MSGTTKLSRGVGLQRGHVSPPVAAFGGNGTSPLYLVRCSVGSVSGHGGVPPCPGSTRLSLGISGSVARARYAHTLRFYITPHFVKWSPVASLKLRLVSSTALRPAGFTKQALCKVACAGLGVFVAPGHWSGASRWAVGPRPPYGLAATRHWPCAGLPVRPQGGSLRTAPAVK